MLSLPLSPSPLASPSVTADMPADGIVICRRWPCLVTPPSLSSVPGGLAFHCRWPCLFGVFDLAFCCCVSQCRTPQLRDVARHSCSHRSPRRIALCRRPKPTSPLASSFVVNGLALWCQPGHRAAATIVEVIVGWQRKAQGVQLMRGWTCV